jgi:hypothetical protein
VLVKGLAPGQTYTYSLSVTVRDPGSVEAAGYPAGGTVTLNGLQLTVPPAKFPLKIGVIADVGQVGRAAALGPALPLLLPLPLPMLLLPSD